MNIAIIGGIYREICAWPPKYNVLGSAGRAAKCIIDLNRDSEVDLYCMIGSKAEDQLNERFAFSRCNIHRTPTPDETEFFYSHPLAKPLIYFGQGMSNLGVPFAPTLKSNNNVIVFGMIEAEVKVEGKRVIYDPQNPSDPVLFSSSGSTAEELIYILNSRELELLHTKHSNNLTESISLEEKANWLMSLENCKSVIVKQGAKGAVVYEDGQPATMVPSFVTDVVNPIGSGDSFVAGFAHSYFVENKSISSSANFASVCAAFYVEHQVLTNSESLSEYALSLVPTKPLVSSKNIYLAGPFFNVQQMWMINECKSIIEGSGLTVFSPIHEIGIGPAEYVAKEDIKAIDNCDAVYAVFDGHDPGTLFEIGYAIKAGKPVIIYSETSSEEELKMYQGTGCVVVRDFSTSFYKLNWILE